MSNNYIFKNLKSSLINTDTIILNNTEFDEIVVIGGYVTNISKVNTPSLSGNIDYLNNLRIYNTETEEIANIYNNILITPDAPFPIQKLTLNKNDQLIISSINSNNLQITLSYFCVVNYNSGLVKVNVNPDLATSHDPKWYIEDDEYSYKDYIPLEKGNYEVEFETILGWEKPENINFYLNALKTVIIDADYVLLDANVTFYVNQPNNIDQFQWRIKDSEIWIDNKESITLTPGTYTFEFKEIDDYRKPNDIIVTLSEKQVYTKEIIYERYTSIVKVDINPPYIKLAKKHLKYNRWRVIYPNNSLSPWFNSGEEIEFIYKTGYKLEIEENEYFQPINNLIPFDLSEDIDSYFIIEMQRL